MVTKAELVEQLDAEQKARIKLEKKVVKVAIKYAEENDWCGVVKEALREAGLGHHLPDEYAIERADKGVPGRKRWVRHLNEIETEKEARDIVAEEYQDSYYYVFRAVKIGPTGKSLPLS